jgi:hypothetical protein
MGNIFLWWLWGSLVVSQLAVDGSGTPTSIHLLPSAEALMFPVTTDDNRNTFRNSINLSGRCKEAWLSNCL